MGINCGEDLGSWALFSCSLQEPTMGWPEPCRVFRRSTCATTLPWSSCARPPLAIGPSSPSPPRSRRRRRLRLRRFFRAPRVWRWLYNREGRMLGAGGGSSAEAAPVVSWCEREASFRRSHKVNKPEPKPVARASLSDDGELKETERKKDGKIQALRILRRR